MSRQPFSSSLSDAFDPYAALRGSTLPTAYYFLRNILVAGALAGGIVALYRNDMILELSRRVGQEQRYLEFEKFFLGSPGWGTPRSMLPVLAGTDETKPSEPVAPAVAAPFAAEPAPVQTTPPAATPVAPSRTETQTARAPAPTPVAAAAPAPVAAARAPVDPLAPVSLESLPLLGQSKPAAAPVAVNSPPPQTRAPAPAPAARSSTTTSGSKARAVSLDDSSPAAAPPRAAKPKPEPAAEPAPVAAKPEPKQPKGPKATDPRPNDNPLLGAIRSAVKARPAKE
jgi:hypothetical protein